MPARVLEAQQDVVIAGNHRGRVQTLRDAWKCRAGRRRSLARQLRRTAACSSLPSRLDRLTVPIRLDRVERVRVEMVSLASALERSEETSPVTIAIVDRLLHDGASPLYDERATESQLASALSAAQRSLTVSTHIPPQSSNYQSSLT